MANAYCGHCGDEPDASFKCKSCDIMLYCSKECQEVDRKFHKLLCKEFSEFIDKPSSEGDVRRAILLPGDGVKPVFTWVPLDIMSDDEEETDQGIDFAHDLGVPSYDSKSGSIMPDADGIPGFGDEGASFHSLVCGKMGGGEPLDHSIRLMVREDFTECGLNRCIEKLLGPWIASRFRGPVLFLRMTKVEDSAYTLDIDSTDFTLALDGLTELAKKQANPMAYFANGGMQRKKVSGIKVNADIPYYEELKFLRTNQVFTTDRKPSTLSQKLGLPLLTATFPTKMQTSTASASTASPALPTAYLHLSIDPKSSDFGTIPTKIQVNTASTIVIGANKTVITTSDVTTLCGFIKDIAEPTLAKASKLSSKDRQAALDSVVEMWKQRAAARDGDSDDTVSSSEDENEDGGFYDDLADAQARTGRMITQDHRTGMAYI